MRILDRHIARSVLGGTMVALFALVAIDVFFAFFNEINRLGRDGYGLVHAVGYMVLTVPRRMYEFFPTAVLLGALLSLGAIAASSELIAMRAAGVSIGQIARSALKAGFVIMLVAFAIGEFVAPVAEDKAQALRSVASGKSVLVRGGGLWARDGNRYVRVGAIRPDQRLLDVEVYEVGEGHRLIAATRAKSAVWEDGEWVLGDVRRSRFTEAGVMVDTVGEEHWPALVTPEMFDVLAVEPHRMSAWSLSKYVLYLRENALDAAPYELAFWTRFTTPLSSLVMLLLALPFVFGSLRTGGAGQRLFVGILIGLGFHIMSQTLNHIGLVYGLSPLASAFAPLLIFLALSLVALGRLR